MNTRDKIEIMQAFVDGKPVEFRDKSRIGDWQRCVDPTWDWWNYNYRVEDSFISYIEDIRWIVTYGESVDSELRCVLENFLREQGNV